MLIALAFAIYTIFGGGTGIESVFGGLTQKEVGQVVEDEDRAARIRSV